MSPKIFANHGYINTLEVFLSDKDLPVKYKSYDHPDLILHCVYVMKS